MHWSDLPPLVDWREHGIVESEVAELFAMHPAALRRFRTSGRVRREALLGHEERPSGKCPVIYNRKAVEQGPDAVFTKPQDEVWT